MHILYSSRAATARDLGEGPKQQSAAADANPVAPVGRGEVRKFLDINGAVSCWQPAQDVTEPVLGLGARCHWSQSYSVHKYPTRRSVTDLYRVHHTTPHHTTPYIPLHYTALH